MNSHKVQLVENTVNGATSVSIAKQESASITDIFTTPLSGDTFITGAYGYLQKGLIFATGGAAGFVAATKIHTKGYFTKWPKDELAADV